MLSNINNHLYNQNETIHQVKDQRDAAKTITNLFLMLCASILIKTNL